MKAIALSFAALALYVGVAATRDLVQANRPDVSAVGIALTAASLLLMPWLAREKRRLAPVLGSRAQQAEAAAAHRHIEGGRTRGKLLLRI